MPLLSVTNLHKTYRLGRTDVPVLRGATLSVEQGEFIAVLGSSGSGKSTLLHLLGGLDKPDKPTKDKPVALTFDGRDLLRITQGERDHYRRNDVGFIFQFYHLLPELSVLDNVLIASMVARGPAYAASARSTREEATALLEAVGLKHRLRHRPVELSGGERQRVAIARALINRPRLLLADEPTGNLDHATGAAVLDMLLRIRAERAQTMIVVTHDRETAARADRTVRIEDGVIAA